MSPKHIVAIPSWYSGGRGSGGGYFRDQALALQAAGHRIAILAPDIHTGRDLRAGRVSREEAGRTIVEHDGIDVYRRPGGCRAAHALPQCLAVVVVRPRPVRRVHGAPRLPDLVHAHACLNAGVLAALIRARHGVPFIVTEHSTGFAEGRLRWWERDLVRRVIARAEARIAVSPHLAALLERQFPALPGATCRTSSARPSSRRLFLPPGCPSAPSCSCARRGWCRRKIMRS